MKPTLLSIKTFDTNKGSSIYYSYTGSMQIVSNELKITDVLTNKIVYQYEARSYEKVHHIPPTILVNGKTYKAEIRVSHKNSGFSEWSNAVIFYTVTTPVLDIVSIDGQGYVYNTDVTFEATYNQRESDQIVRYRFSLYDENNILLKNYPMRYNDKRESLTTVHETIGDLRKSQGYYIEVMIETEKGMFHSQKEKFIPMYVTPFVNGVINAENDEDNGFVRVNARLKQLLGTAITANKSYNYKYHNEDWIEIPNEAPVMFKGLGMNRASDFIMKTWFRKVPVGEMFLSLTQEDGLISIDFYREKGRVVAKKYINNVCATYTSNVLSVSESEEVYMYVKVIEHRIEIEISRDNI